MKTFKQYLESKTINFDMGGRSQAIALGQGENDVKRVDIPISQLPPHVAQSVLDMATKLGHDNPRIIKVTEFKPPFDFRSPNFERMMGKMPGAFHDPVEYGKRPTTSSHDIFQYEVELEYGNKGYHAAYGVNIHGVPSLWAD
jgi:hypothetical protein